MKYPEQVKTLSGMQENLVPIYWECAVLLAFNFLMLFFHKVFALLSCVLSWAGFGCTGSSSLPLHLLSSISKTLCKGLMIPILLAVCTVPGTPAHLQLK